MPSLSERTQILRQAGFNAALAFAAACAERVVPVFEQRWVGSPSTAPREAVDLAWAAAEGRISEADAQRVAGEVRDIVLFYNEESITILAQSVTAALRAAECVTGAGREDSFAAAARASGSSLYVAILVDGYLRPGQSPDPARAEEEDWISAALKELSSKAVSRRMFEQLGPPEPSWLARYLDAGGPL